MYLKTTSIQCMQFCGITKNLPIEIQSSYRQTTIDVTSKRIGFLTVSKHPVYVQVLDGIAGVAFAHTNNDQPGIYAIHRILIIHPGVRYAFVTLSRGSQLRVYIHPEDTPRMIDIPVFEVASIQPKFEIEEIYAYYYSSKGNSYHFDGESHVYWEMTYVDNGELICTVDQTEYVLPPRSIMFFAPRQFHTQQTRKKTTCSYLTIMFSMKFDNPSLLSNKVFPISKFMNYALSGFIHHANTESPTSSEFLCTELKQLILYALQNNASTQENPSISTPMQQHFEDEMLNEITHYINERVEMSLNIDTICDKFGISRSTLQILFKKHLNTSPKHYMNARKLERSKILLKESSYTISQISDLLGFTTIHYFSRKFKQEYGVAPSEYSKSIVQ